MPSALRVLTAVHREHKGSREETASWGGGCRSWKSSRRRRYLSWALKAEWETLNKDRGWREEGRAAQFPTSFSLYKTPRTIKHQGHNSDMTDTASPQPSLLADLLHLSGFTMTLLLLGSPPPRLSTWLAPAFSSPLYCPLPVPDLSVSSLWLCAHLCVFLLVSSTHFPPPFPTMSPRQGAGPQQRAACVLNGR